MAFLKPRSVTHRLVVLILGVVPLTVRAVLVVPVVATRVPLVTAIGTVRLTTVLTVTIVRSHVLLRLLTCSRSILSLTLPPLVAPQEPRFLRAPPVMPFAMSSDVVHTTPRVLVPSHMFSSLSHLPGEVVPVPAPLSVFWLLDFRLPLAFEHVSLLPSALYVDSRSAHTRLTRLIAILPYSLCTAESVGWLPASSSRSTSQSSHSSLVGLGG